MRALLDVNALIALVQPDHVHHQAAHQWWSENGESGWASCPLTENGFVRVVTQPRYPRPIPVPHAVELLRAAVAGTDHEFWSDDISLRHDARFDPARLLGPKRLTDTYLLALAVEHDARLATCDRAISLTAVRGAQARNLVVI